MSLSILTWCLSIHRFFMWISNFIQDKVSKAKTSLIQWGASLVQTWSMLLCYKPYQIYWDLKNLNQDANLIASIRTSPLWDKSIELSSKLSITILASPSKIKSLIPNSFALSPSLIVIVYALTTSITAINCPLQSQIIASSPIASSASNVAPLMLNLNTPSGKGAHFSSGHLVKYCWMPSLAWVVLKLLILVACCNLPCLIPLIPYSFLYWCH